MSLDALECTAKKRLQQTPSDQEEVTNKKPRSNDPSDKSRARSEKLIDLLVRYIRGFSRGAIGGLLKKLGYNESQVLIN
nr:5930_t:CDS:2 [Entrophospora candida]